MKNIKNDRSAEWAVLRQAAADHFLSHPALVKITQIWYNQVDKDSQQSMLVLDH